MTAPALARWDDTRARIQAIRAKLPTASTEQVHDAVILLLDLIEEDIATDGHRGPEEPTYFYRLGGQAQVVARLAGVLVPDVTP